MEKAKEKEVPVTDNITESLLDAPCVFCGYKGHGYYQAGTHKKNCPWREVGGLEERAKRLRSVVAEHFEHYKEEQA